MLSSLDNVNSWTLTFGKTPLPLWDEELWSNGAQWAELPALKAELDACDGFVVIAPNGTARCPPHRRTFFYCGPPQGELSHKPALACAVSASDGGAYVIAELRMSSYKNNRLCWIPEHLRLPGTKDAWQ